MQSGWKFTLGLSAVLMMLGGRSEQQERNIRHAKKDLVEQF